MNAYQPDHELLSTLGLEDPDPLPWNHRIPAYVPSLDHRAENRQRYGHEQNSGIGTLVYGDTYAEFNTPSIEKLPQAGMGAAALSLLAGESSVDSQEIEPALKRLDIYKREAVAAHERGRSKDYIFAYLDHEARDLSDAEAEELGTYIESLYTLDAERITVTQQ